MANGSPHPDAESIAAKLQRIRAVVGSTAATEAHDDSYLRQTSDLADSDLSDYMEAEDDIDLSALISDKADVPVPVVDDLADMAADAGTASDVDEYEDDDDALLSSLSDKIAPVAAPIQVAVAETAAASSDDETSLAAIAADLAATKAVEAEAEAKLEAEALAEAEAQAEADAIAEAEAQAEAEAVSVNDAVKAITQDAPDAAPQPVVRAQVLRLRKSDRKDLPEEAPSADVDVYDDEGDNGDEDLINVALLDGVADLDGFEDATDYGSTLSADEEAELRDELADVERTFGDTATDEDVVADLQDIKQRNTLPETDDATMSHLLEQTDKALDEPEGNRRRDAIAQLKAAVAATEAARQLGDTQPDAAEAEGAFRGDLDEVVRPSRPSQGVQPAARTARPRPAPLKLVASQRVDTPAAKSDTVVAPRRVETSVENVSPAEASNFAEFAESMGASALPDLLEAAAAYTAFVEGSEDFSRPQIMKKVQLTSDVEFSREDGLRSFGKLLREGRISKVRNGRFIGSDETRFRPAV